MGGSRLRQSRPRSRSPSRVDVRVLRGETETSEASFAGAFIIGRSEDCDLQLRDASVAPNHLQVIFDGIVWWIRDLSGSSGTYINGERIQVVPLSEEISVELGRNGPLLSLMVSREPSIRTGTLSASTSESPAAARTPTASLESVRSETQILQRYLRPIDDQPAGRETMMFRRAFARAQKKLSRRYQIAIGAALLVLLGAGSVIAYQARKIQALRATAERLFYATKSVELQTAKLEEIVLLHADPAQVTELRERRAQLTQMEKEYDAFVRELGVYDKVSENERIILRVARAFGECEVNMPKGFVAEVQRYAERWKSTDRFPQALQKAKQRGYAQRIARIFTDRNLPPQYLYLALQESAFNERAVGPSTRYGFAKGMWQFISPTARRYGLRIGPLHDQAVYDPQDERFDWEKATVAAASYIKDLTSTRAQASGLLVLASYNWGENKVRDLIDLMPENPQERNFWRLLRDKNVPDETYDYVLSIFAAAVICEDPRLFGFNGECPRRGG